MRRSPWPSHCVFPFTERSRLMGLKWFGPIAGVTLSAGNWKIEPAGPPPYGQANQRTR